MGTWGGPDDAAGDRLRAEHGMTAWFDGTYFLASAGNEALLPEWPPTVNLPHLVVPLSAEGPDPLMDSCAGCGTPISLRGDEWRHEVGFNDRDGCTEPRPS